jgi:hypothetical protein
MLKKILYTVIFICVVLQLVAFLLGEPNMPEVFGR